MGPKYLIHLGVYILHKAKELSLYVSYNVCMIHDPLIDSWTTRDLRCYRVSCNIRWGLSHNRMMRYGCFRASFVGERDHIILDMRQECILCSQYIFHHLLECRTLFGYITIIAASS